MGVELQLYIFFSFNARWRWGGQRHAPGAFPPFIGFILAGMRTRATAVKFRSLSLFQGGPAIFYTESNNFTLKLLLALHKVTPIFPLKNKSKFICFWNRKVSKCLQSNAQPYKSKGNAAMRLEILLCCNKFVDNTIQKSKRTSRDI